MSIPSAIGTMAATRLMKGISAIPDAPRASSVKKGPSLSARIGKQPQFGFVAVGVNQREEY